MFDFWNEHIWGNNLGPVWPWDRQIVAFRQISKIISIPPRRRLFESFSCSWGGLSRIHTFRWSGSPESHWVVLSRIFICQFLKFMYGYRLVNISISSKKAHLTYDCVEIYEMEDVWRCSYATCVSCTSLMVLVSLWHSSSWKRDVPKAPFPEPRAQLSSGWCYEAWESCSVFSTHLQWR